MDDEPAESQRFWRNNTLSAYKGVNLDERTAVTPQDLEYMQNAKAEIKQLTDRENAVQSRLKQIKDNHKKRMTNDDKKMIKIDANEWENGYLSAFTGGKNNAGGYSFSSGYIEGKADKVLIPLNPKLRADFDITPNEERSPAEIKKWWNKPYIITTTFEENQADKSFDEYEKRLKSYGYTDLKNREEWEAEKQKYKADWLESFPTNTRYEVRCLDGGAWDRSTWHGTFPQLSEAVNFAKSLNHEQQKSHVENQQDRQQNKDGFSR